MMSPQIFCSFLAFFSLFYFLCPHVLSSSLRPVCALPTWYDITLLCVNPYTCKQTFSEPPLHSMLIQIEFKSTQLIFPQLVMVLFLRSFFGQCCGWIRPPLWSSGQSSSLHDGDVSCFLWGTNSIYICYVEENRPPLWSSGQSSWLHNGDVSCFLWGTNSIYIC
jgi:hypothetical protein